MVMYYELGLVLEYKLGGAVRVYFSIEIEDLVANAMIEVLRRSGRRFITYREIEAYGMEVIQILKERGERAVLVLSREKTRAFLRNYAEYFEESVKENGRGVKLKEGKGAGDLIQQFRGYLALNVLLAFMNQRSTRLLGAQV